MSERDTPRRSAQSAAGDDAWNRRLLIAVLVTVVLVLTAVIYVVYTGVLVGRAPRTQVERELQRLEASFKSNQDDPVVVADYMRVLVEGELYSKARSVLETFRSTDATASAAVSTQEARLLRSTGDIDAALDVADRALHEAESEKQAQIDEYAGQGISAPFSSSEIVEACLMKAEILVDMGRVDEAVDVLDAALAELPTMADVLVWRGDLETELGRTDEAQADYEKALGMIPDYQPALDGLAELSGGDAQ